MPPADSSQPTAEEKKAFLEPLRQQLHRASFEQQQREARGLMRRLNRSEYQHTLHDLLGVATNVKAILPEDSVVAGFDKVGTGLETSAVHLVRYQEAAAKALAAALPSRVGFEVPIKKRQTGREVLEGRHPNSRAGTDPYVRIDGEALIFHGRTWKHGSIFTATTPAAGRYRVRAQVSAIANQGKPMPVLIGKISSDRFGHEKVEHVIDFQDAPADQKRVLDVTAILIEGEQVYLEGLTLPFFGDLAKQLKGQPVGKDFPGPGLSIDWIEIEGPFGVGEGYRQFYGSLPRVPHRYFEQAVAGKKITDDWSKWHPNEFEKEHNRLRLVSPNPQADAEKFIRNFLNRAFRRPVPDSTVAEFLQPALQHLVSGRPLDDVLQDTYLSILCSPHFFMQVAPPGPLDDYALASRLSYFLWDSMPDDELWEVAARGELSRPEVLRAQTDRMLQDWKAERFMESFAGQWLELRKIHDMKPDTVYTEFDELLAWSMPEETRRFFKEMLVQDLPVTDFVDSKWSMLNSRMAQHYGISGVVGMDLRRTELPADSHRGGILTQASIMKLTTNSTYTSPVKRGAWVLDRILGTPPSPPPPNVAAIEPDIRGAVTIREQLAKHQSVEVCASCHVRIDPPGFSLENYDVLGGWREFYRSKDGSGEGKQYVALANYPEKKVYLARPVEASGTAAGGESFRNFDDYRKILAKSPDQLARNLAQKLLIYSTGTQIQFADREAIEEIVAATRSKGYGFRSLIHEVVQSRVFKTR